MIEFIHYSVKTKTSTILNDVSLVIPQGQCLVVCGASGCGKSTLLKVINGLVHQEPQLMTSGELKYDNQSLDDVMVEDRARYIGSLFQNPKRQFFYGNVKHELAFGCENLNMPREHIEATLHQTIQQFDMAHLLDKSLFHCSGGQKQKVACAAITTIAPDIYVLDEPSANLDKVAVQQLQQILVMLKQQGKTLIIAEHYLTYLLPIMDHVIYLKSGTLTHQWSAEDFKKLSIEQLQQLGLRQLQAPRLTPTYHNQGQLVISHLHYHYPRSKEKILNINHLAFKRGRLTALSGHNGIGKTTLAKLLTGELKSHQGHIILDGVKLSQRQRLQHSYIVMQDVNCQLFCESVEQEITLGKKLTTEMQQLIEEFDLQDVLVQHPMTLSGGQKQRLAVVCACLMNREIIIFDEPTSGLDYKNMTTFIKLCRQLTDKQKIVIVITHDEQLLTHCDDIVELSEYNRNKD